MTPLDALDTLPTSPSTPSTCGACGALMQGPFCHQCGQRHAEGRLTVVSLLRQLPTRLFNLDRGFFHTFIDLFRHPGGVPRDFVDGRRSPYTNPLTYFLVAATVQLIALSLSEGAMQASLVEQFSQDPGALEPITNRLGDNAVGKMASLYISLIKQGYTYLFLLFMSLPFAVFLRLLTFRLTPHHNLAENAVFALYTSAHLVLVTGLMAPFTMRIDLNLHAFGSITIYFVYTALAVRRFYGPGFGRKLLVLLALAGAFLLFVVVLIGLFVVLLMQRMDTGSFG